MFAHGGLVPYQAGSWVLEESTLLQTYAIELVLISCLSGLMHTKGQLNSSFHFSYPVNIFGFGYGPTFTLGFDSSILINPHLYEPHEIPQSALDFYHKYQSIRLTHFIFLGLSCLYHLYVENDRWVLRLHQILQYLSILEQPLILIFGHCSITNLPWYFDSDTQTVLIPAEDQYLLDVGEWIDPNWLPVPAIIINKTLRNGLKIIWAITVNLSLKRYPRLYHHLAYIAAPEILLVINAWTITTSIANIGAHYMAIWL